MAAMTKPLYLEDFEPGRRYELGSFTLTEAEIVEFAERYDPQAIHVDAAAAADGPFGGIIASGWQTAAAVMRLMVDNFIPSETALASPGMEELRWLAPVRPDVTYTAHVVVEETRPSSSKPDRGSIWTTMKLSDPDGTVVYRARGIGIYRRRPA